MRAKSASVLQSNTKSTKSTLFIPRKHKKNKRLFFIRTQTVERFPYRLIVLILIVLSLLAHFFCYDNPGSMEPELLKVFNVERDVYSLFYTGYSFPNALFPILGGIILDTYGYRVSAMLFISLIILGQAVWVLGAVVRSFAVSVVGRVVFGAGSESFMLTVENLVVKWFAGRGLSAAISLHIMADGIFQALNFIFVPIVIEQIGLDWSLTISLMTCVVSFLSTIGWLVLDYWGDQYASYDFFDEDSEEEGCDTEAMTGFGSKFYVLVLCSTCFFSHSYTFFSMAEDLLVNYYGVSAVDAGYVASLPFLTTCLCPVLGFFVDTYGHKGKLIIVAPFISAFGYSMMLYSDMSSGGVFLILSIAFFINLAIISSLIPSVVWENLGTAYGIEYASINTAMGLSNFFFGWLVSVSGYRMVAVASIGICGLQAIFSMYLYFWNHELLDANEDQLEEMKREYFGSSSSSTESEETSSSSESSSYGYLTDEVGLIN